jgi:hypothetical protein
MANRRQRIEAAERRLLGDMQKLSSRQFVYEDGWCGMVPFDGKLSEMQTGPPVSFAELTWREQADVLRSFIPWGRYPERAWDDEYRIRENIAAGKPPEQWLDGTSLRESFRLLAEGKTPRPPEKGPDVTQEDLVNALAKAGARNAQASLGELKAEGEGKQPQQAPENEHGLEGGRGGR